MNLVLSNLSIDHVILLNKISSSMKKIFNNLCEEIYNNSNKSLEFLLHSIMSRNPYQSNLFINCCLLELTKELLESDQNLEKIITWNKQLHRIIYQYVKDNNYPVKVEIKDIRTIRQKIKYSCLPVIDLYVIINKSIRYLIVKNKKQKYNFENRQLVLLDTFILSDSINSGKYIDRYYTGILEDLTSDKKRDIYFVPSFIGKFTKKQLHQIYQNSKEQILYKHNYLQLSDYVQAIFALAKMKFPKNDFFFHGFNVTSLIKSEFDKTRYNASSFGGLLNYYFIKRLNEQQISIKLLIDWNENQPIDKGLIKGVRDFFPDTYIKGYQGFIISTDFNFYIQPTDFEIKNGVIPDEICVIGISLEKRIKKYSNNIKVTTAPAYRFQGVYKKCSINVTNNKVLLVALPIGLNESYDIMNVLHKAFEYKTKYNYKIRIKPHPVLKINKLISLFRDKWNNNFEIAEGDFTEILVNSDMLIGNASTTLIEALSRGISVAVIGSQSGITQNPIPSFVDKNMWQLCYLPEELSYAIDTFMGKTEQYKEELKEKGEQMKRMFFEPITKKATLAFLEI